jgi:vacuolar-type H+-ATPase subunit E/Vma4
MNPQEDKLQAEIISDAKNRAERILARANNDADKARQQAAEENERSRQERLAEGEAEAEARCRSILVDIQQETRRRWLLASEARLAAFLHEALAAVERAEGIDRERSLTLLAREALAAIGPGDCEVLIRPDDAALVTPEWLSALAQDIHGDQGKGRYAVQTQAKLSGGLILSSRDGRRRYDNSYATRLSRLWDDLRSLASQ